MEVKDLVESIGNALYRMGGQYLIEKFPGGAMFLSDDSVSKDNTAGFHDETHLAEWFNWERRESNYETVPGTFVVRSYKAGAGGEYRFLAGDELLSALAFVTIQDSKENTYDVVSQDAHSGAVVAFATAQSGDTVNEILPGDAALKFDSASGVKQIVYDEKTGKYDFEMESNQKLFVHISANDATLQTGANEGEKLSMRIRNMSASSLGLDRLYVTDSESAKRAISTLDRAIGSVSSMRAMLGAYQNRLEHTVSNLSVAQTNITASKSRITDADYAVEMMNFTKLSILTQSNVAIMAQARALPENILSLLR
jgi:flagellin